MFEPRVKVRRALYEKVEQAAAALNCASVEEFVEQALETAADRALNRPGRQEISEKEVEEIANKLKGLGYLD